VKMITGGEFAIYIVATSNSSSETMENYIYQSTILLHQSEPRFKQYDFLI